MLSSLFFLHLSIYLFIYFGHVACKFLVPWPGIERRPQKWKHWVLTTGPPGNSLLSSLLFNTVPARAIRQEKEIKSIQTGKEEVKLSIFADDMIPYIKNPKESSKKLLELKISPATLPSKINKQKSIVFLYTSNEQSESEVKKTIPFTIGTVNYISKKKKKKNTLLHIPIPSK